MATNNEVMGGGSITKHNVPKPEYVDLPLDYHSPLLDRFFNSSIGFQEVLDRMFQNVPQKIDNYPPYNLMKYDSGYLLDIAVAGFSADDIRLYIEGGCLIIEGKQPRLEQRPEGFRSKIESSNCRSAVHRGLAKRDFRQVLKISDLIEVQEARLENGILSVWLAEMKPDPPDRKYIKIQ